MVKKTYIFFILIIIIHFDSNICGQGIINNSSNFYLSANSNLILSGNANWVQNGTVTCASNSNVKFTGTNYQYIQGSNSTSFYNVVTNNSGGGIVAGRNFSVLGTLTLTQGHFDLKSYTIDLSTSGTVSGENENARIRATSGTTGGGTEGGNTGTIRATRNNPSGNIAGLNLDFTPASALGNNTLIERGCNALQGTGSYTGNYSIYRWYKITPGSSISQLTINQFKYWGGSGNTELNGHTEANLQMFQLVQYGAGNPIYWEPRTSTPNTGSDYVSSTTTNSIINLNYILVSLGSTSDPLPVELMYFDATCKNSINVLTWQTASENNNAGFNLEKSNNSFDWENFGFIEGNGNSNTVNSYSYEDNSPYSPVTYYRLQQVDFDGNSKYSDIIPVQCNENNVNEEMTPFYSNGHILMNIVGNNSNNYTIIVTNSIGQIMTTQDIKLNSPTQSVILEKHFTQGLYYVSLISEKSIISKPVVIPE